MEVIRNPEVKPLNHLSCAGMNRVENRDAKIVGYVFNTLQYTGKVLPPVYVLLSVCGDKDVATLLNAEP